ncbi:MAG: serine hydrolase, partial [Hyphomonadaceae bacterium]|nr:serine hydrolase [Hyphomonadaceae bacterium]
MKYIKYIFLPAFIIASIAGLIVFRNLDARAEIYVGYMTKIMCSEHFVAGRNVEDIRAQDFFGIDPAVERINISVDSSSGKVTGNVFGVLGRSAAQYRADAGCTPAARGGVEPVKIPKPDPLPHRFEEYIRPDIQAIVDAAIGDTGPEAANRTRALLVLQDGKIVGEAYGNGFDKHIPMQSWSMAKTVTAMLVGVLIDDGRLDIHRQNLFREWTDDDRVNIQLNHLLRMESGLDAHEVYDATSDVVQMLFRDRNTGTFAINKPLESQPGEVFEYSSATTSLISHLLRQTLGDNA